MSLTANSIAPAISAEWLVSRTFTFSVGSSDARISDRFAFHKNGFIVGYSHPNEAFWQISDGNLEILNESGGVTCRLSFGMGQDGRAWLAGHFRDPSADYVETQALHILQENGSDYHSQIQSFDLFDTLVARRCYEPLAVFQKVEEKCGVRNFAIRRHLVEMSIFGQRTYGLGDIYEMLVLEGLITPRQAATIQLMELAEEWDTLFLIGELVARVNADDIIISDMYLPLSFVERVVREKCGLNNRIYLSNYGKHHRLIWPGLLEQHKLRLHFGDNVQADILGPAAFNIPVSHVTISKWSHAEEILHRAGLGRYAYAVREARLRTFHPNPIIQNAIKAQITINIPLMILGTFWVKSCAEKYGADTILAASRDCNLWHEMLSSSHFSRMGIPRTTYIQISRTLCFTESAEYEAYFKSQLGSHNLLLDFVGTGRSLRHAVALMGLEQVVHPCILVADPVNHGDDRATLDSLVQKDFFNYRIYFEALNATLDGSAVAAISEAGVIRILTQPNEFGELSQQIISEVQNAFRSFLGHLDRIDPPSAFPSAPNLRAAADAIVELIPEQAANLAHLHSEQKKNLVFGSIGRALEAMT